MAPARAFGLRRRVEPFRKRSGPTTTQPSSIEEEGLSFSAENPRDGSGRLTTGCYGG